VLGKPGVGRAEASLHHRDREFRGSVGKPVFTFGNGACAGVRAMALLDETRLVAEQARRAKYRLHHVGTKLNEGELREFEALAAKRSQTQAELIRGLILKELKGDLEGLRPSAEMVEITACRLLVVNLLRQMAMGQPMTVKAFDGIIDEVKKQRYGWLVTGSRITWRGAEHRWRSLGCE